MKAVWKARPGRLFQRGILGRLKGCRGVRRIYIERHVMYKCRGKYRFTNVSHFLCVLLHWQKYIKGNAIHERAALYDEYLYPTIGYWLCITYITAKDIMIIRYPSCLNWIRLPRHTYLMNAINVTNLPRYAQQAALHSPTAQCGQPCCHVTVGLLRGFRVWGW